MLDSTGKIRFVFAGVLALGLSSCLVDAPQPDLGDCSVPPEGRDVYEYGEIGIGTCLASPSDIQVLPDPEDPTNYFLVVANSNARVNFSGSSLLSIDAASIDLTCPANGMHELGTNALAMREFAGRFDRDPATGLTLLTSRYSGGFEGDEHDAVFVLDTSDPRDLQFSDLAPRETGPYRWLRVPRDPWSVRVDPATGRAWLLSIIDHTVSSVDLLSDPIALQDLYGERSTSPALFEDVDGSGSAPDFTLIGVNDDALRDEQLTLTFVVGTTRLYFPGVDGQGSFGLFQADSGDGRSFHVLPGGSVLGTDRPWNVGGFGAASIAADAEGLFGLIAGVDEAGLSSIGYIESPEQALNWSANSSVVLAPALEGWDADGVAHPDWIAWESSVLGFYSGGAGLGQAIGRARGSSLSSLSRSGDPDLADTSEGLVLEASDAGFDAAAVFGPSVLVHGDTGEVHLYYAGHADLAAESGVPVGTAIGLATSSDARSFIRPVDGPVLSPGEPGDWDSEAVAFPSVFYDNGRYQMWYQGWDGSEWATGRALSVDGRSWTKDPANPVFAGVFDSEGEPTRAFAFKASPGGYYRIDGTVSGDAIDYALEGEIYETTGTPILFRVVGGQALGRGPEGAHDVDGVFAPSAVSDSYVLYVGQRGTSQRAAVALDNGAALTSIAAIEFEGFGGGLDGLNGTEPTANVPDLSATSTPDGELLVALQSEFGIAFAQGTPAVGTNTVTGFVGLPATSLLTVGEPTSFDGVSVGSPSLLLAADDSLLLFYEGSDGSRQAIGLATSEDGSVWTRHGEGPVFSRGASGGWDDAWVGSPSVVLDDEGLFHLWYVGSDGSSDRVGYATSADGLSWNRHVDASGVSVPVFDGAGLPFALDGVARPSVTLTDEGFEMWFEGLTDGVSRIGRAWSRDGVTWTPVLNPTTAGDRFTIATTRGDDDATSAIQLGDDSSNPRFIDGFVVHGAGATEMILSPDGERAVISNKRAPFLIVLDLQDNSTEEWTDANRFDIEGIIRVPQAHGMVGMRDLHFGPEGFLWATMSPLIVPEAQPAEDPIRYGTEALIKIDWAQVEAEDLDKPEAWLDLVVGYTPLARGIEEDEGYRTEVSVAASSFAMRADGSRAYVTNFNENSLYILKLDGSARGSVLKMIRGLDENPWEVVLSPDENLAFVATTYGVRERGAQHSTIQVIDVDETSPTFGSVLTRLTNLESRSDHGCD